MLLPRARVWASVFLLIGSTTLPAQVLRRDTAAEPESLDPHKTDSIPATTVERDLYEGLVIFAPDGKITGGAAQSWKISSDGLQYTFQLRPRLQWSNGEDLTASADDYPMIPIYDFVQLRMVRKSVTGYAPNAIGCSYSKNIAVSSEKKK